MIQDFAKLRARQAADETPAAAPPAWSLVLTGAVAGAAAGVFLCALLYMSGRIPPPPGAAAAAPPAPPRDARPEEAPGDAEPSVDFGFYEALPAYEVRVDAVPVDLGSRDPARALDTLYTLQTGAFQQRRLAEAEALRQRALGLDARVAESRAPAGRVLYLIRSGPYATVGELDRAETTLRRNGIRGLRLGAR